MAAAGAALPASAGLQVPSGQPVELQEVRADETAGALWLRFRFVAPQIGRIDRDADAADMEHLCTAVALPYLAETGIEAERLVISLSERAVPFGEAAPGTIQFFETYSAEDGRCIWEGF